MGLKGKILLLLISLLTCSLQAKVYTGADQTYLYLNKLKGKNIALVVNQTSTIENTHLADSLKSLNIKIQKIFAPEHGFRGDKSAGTTVKDGIDTKTGLPVISLYGNHKKPTKDDLKGIDIVVFDIQDVGVRYYTYISTMHYVMEACAENKIKFIVLDRPNPNGHYVDGPVLDSNINSFVGMHRIPLVHGCTVAELARMINGEHWLKSGIQCELEVIACKNYSHQTEYVLPIHPSPNLQTQSSIYLYPSLGLLEGTIMSMGHGTPIPYQCFGSPALDWGNIDFTPRPQEGISENPKFKGISCIGFDLTEYGFEKARADSSINLNWLILSYRTSKNKPAFFSSFFTKLAGTTELRYQIEKGWTADDIRASWQSDIHKYLKIRAKYLLYP